MLQTIVELTATLKAGVPSSNLLRKFQPQSTRPARVSVDSLPDEILEHIFILGVQLHACSERGRSSKRFEFVKKGCNCAHRFRSLVSGVSRRWRDVAMDTSRLWTTVYVSSLTSPGALQRHLERSRIRPLDIHIVMQPVCDGMRPRISQNDLGALIDVLLKHLGRWRELHIVTPLSEIIRFIFWRLSMEGIRAPELEVFEVECPFGLLWNPNQNAYPKPFPGGAPRLQHLQLYRCGFPLSPEDPLPALRSFSVASAAWTLSDLHTLSVSSPCLTHLAITSSYKLEALVPLHFPALKTLRIGDYFQNDIILRLLHAPNLEVLQIEEMKIQHSVTATWYVDALRNSDNGQGKFPKLRSLRLHMPGFPGDPSALNTGPRFREFLSLFPSITHVAFVGFHVLGFVEGLAVLHAGSGIESEEPLLPKLEHVTFGGEHEAYTMTGAQSTAFLNTVSALARARKSVGAPLKRVQVPERILSPDHQSLWDIFRWRRPRHIEGAALEGLAMPYSPDIWLGYRWGLQVLRENTTDISAL